VSALANAKHEAFCQQFLVDLNASAAYRRAYPDAKPKSAEASGCRLLGNVKVAARLAELKAERAERNEVTADMVIQELARIGFSDMRAFSNWGPGGVRLIDSNTLTEDQARCIAEVAESTSKDGGSLKFKLHDKVGALVKLGQHLGIRFVERHEHTGKDGEPLPTAQVVVYEIPDNGRGGVLRERVAGIVSNGRKNGHRGG
jgi:phage terminase small subunit